MPLILERILTVCLAGAAMQGILEGLMYHNQGQLFVTGPPSVEGQSNDEHLALLQSEIDNLQLESLPVIMVTL